MPAPRPWRFIISKSQFDDYQKLLQEQGIKVNPSLRQTSEDLHLQFVGLIIINGTISLGRDTFSFRSHWCVKDNNENLAAITVNDFNPIGEVPQSLIDAIQRAFPGAKVERPSEDHGPSSKFGELLPYLFLLLIFGIFILAAIGLFAVVRWKW